jgi:ATP/maltotriose-dependent transcriptional regulator MalT/DNA-binding SARP family transcriptional activator
MCLLPLNAPRLRSHRPGVALDPEPLRSLRGGLSPERVRPGLAVPLRAHAPRRSASDHPVLRAKLSRPNLGAHVLERPHLIRALIEHGDRSLTLVVADAGYGKTTLLAGYARAVARPVIWYSLMGSDADPVVFGRYLLEGFRREHPRFGRDFHLALEEARPGLRSVEMLAGTLANELATLKGPSHLLVLDDFHEVSGNPQVVAFMDLLLRHLPPKVRVVVGSRAVPPLGLERMRVRGDVFELNSSHLRLTREELARLFADVYQHPLGEEDLSALERTTLGWPTAVHLVYESLRHSERATLEEVLADFHASNLELHSYLSSEVYARLDGDARRMLERTAALTRFDADLAATLAGPGGDPRALLESLARRGLLRTFGTGLHSSYECHDLVRRFIRQEIEAAGGPSAWRALEADSAAALAARGEPERALRHFLAADRAVDAAALLRELGPQLLVQGRAAALLQYLGDLPAETLRADMALAVALADARQALGQWDEAEALYHEVLNRCRESADPLHECLGLIGLGKMLNLRGGYEQVLGMAERGLALAQDLGIDIRARLLQMKAGAHFYLGQYRAAVRVLDEVRALLPAGADPDLLLPILHNLAGAYAAQGRFHEASREFRTALAQVRGTASPRAPLYLSNLAFHLAELGELTEARRAADEGLQAAQRFSNRALETSCHEALAQILAQSGDLDGALSALKRAEELNAELRMEFIALDLLALRARIFCARGQYRRAVEFLSEAIERLAQRPSSPQLTEFRATLSWCELRAGRVRVARDLLQSLVARADAGENDYQRMRVHYWLAESLLAMGDRRNVDTHLTRALKLVRERGYAYFLRVQSREEPAPLLYALSRDIETGVVSAALVEAGATIEESLLGLLADAPPAVGEAAVAVLGEVGSRAAHEGLERLAHRRRSLQPAVRTARRHIAERLARGAAAAAAEPRLPRLVLFGPPQLQIEGRPVAASAWRAQRAFHMLVFLALHPRGAGKDELLEHFWPGRQLAAGRRNFHPTLSYVRSVLPRSREAAILREGEYYRLNPAYRLTCDAWEVDRALDEARAARDAAGRRRSLERAAVLATEPFLEGVYGGWAEELQARTRDRVEKLLLDLGALCAQAGDHDAALGHFRRAAELDEFREGTRVAMIEAMVRVGNRRAALAEYDKLKALLRAELDVDPLPETERAVQGLLAAGQETAARATVATTA